MKLLVTGCLGFIGSNFVRHMASNYSDMSFINIDKMGIGSNSRNLEDFEKKESSYTFIKEDISRIKNLEKILDSVDAVINFAAETHVDRSISNPAPFIESNIMGVFNLLEAIRKMDKPIRYVQISTDEIYGDILEGTFSETDRLKPSNPYSASKAAADMLCLAYNRTYGVEVLITRCTNNFGPFQYPEKLIPKTIIRAEKNLQIPIYGTGENIRDWLYVLDHCEAIDLVMRKGQSGEIYNISSGNEISTISIAEKILDYLNKPRDLITFVEDRPGHDLRYGLDSQKIRENLNWEPKHRFDDSLRKTIEWYKNNSSWWISLLDSKVLDETPWKSNQ